MGFKEAQRPKVAIQGFLPFPGSDMKPPVNCSAIDGEIQWPVYLEVKKANRMSA